MQTLEQGNVHTHTISLLKGILSERMFELEADKAEHRTKASYSIQYLIQIDA